MARGRATVRQKGNIRRRPAPGRSKNAPVKRGLNRLSGSTQTILHLQRSIGNRATLAYLQRQDEEKKEEGSATVVGSATKEEEATDTGSFSKELAKERKGDKTPTEEELSESLKERGRKPHKVGKFHSQHPSLAQIGIRPKEIKGKKLGAYVGNEKYPSENWDSLPGAKADASKIKSTMEGHDYKTLKHARDKNSAGIKNVFASAIGKAGAGDALILYYAGHGIPSGVVGVESQVSKPGAEKEEADEEKKGEDTRGVRLAKAKELEADKKANYKGYHISDVSEYSDLMGSLEAGVGKGVHTTMIIDACHSGAAADLVRDKAIEKVSEGGNARVKGVTEQIGRLKDMKKQIPAVESANEGDRGFKLGKRPIELEGASESEAEVYWKKTVHPELKQVAAYLKEAGFAVTVPERPGEFTKAGIEQQINHFINQLIDLAEKLKKEAKESTLAKTG